MNTFPNPTLRLTAQKITNRAYITVSYSSAASGMSLTPIGSHSDMRMCRTAFHKRDRSSSLMSSILSTNSSLNEVPEGPGPNPLKSRVFRKLLAEAGKPSSWDSYLCAHTIVPSKRVTRTTRQQTIASL